MEIHEILRFLEGLLNKACISYPANLIYAKYTFTIKRLHFKCQNVLINEQAFYCRVCYKKPNSIHKN